MKTKVSKSNHIRALFRWLTLVCIGMSMSLSLKAAQSLTSNMAVINGIATGALSNLTLDSEGKVVVLSSDASNSGGQSRVKFRFPAKSFVSN